VDATAEFKNNLASWLGPTKLAKAIVFATITNIVAYLPFLLLSGDVYFFLYSLPVVIEFRRFLPEPLHFWHSGCL